MMRLTGIGASEGISIGKVLLYFEEKIFGHFREHHAWI